MSRVLDIVVGVKDAVVDRVKGFMSLRDPILDWLRGTGEGSSAKHVGDPFKQAIYTYTGIAAIARTVARVPFHVLGPDQVPVENHEDESVRLLRKPNAGDDWKAFVERTLTLKYRDGQVYWVKSEQFDRPLQRAVFVVPAREMSPHIVDGLLVGWRRRRDGREEFLPLDRVCRMFFVDPDDELGGQAPWRVAQLAIDSHTHAARYNVNVFFNGAEPGSTYSTDKSLTGDQHEQLERRIEKRHGGVGNVNRPMVISGGLHREPPQNNRDLQFIEGQKETAKQQIAPLFVQPILAGLYDEVNYSTANVQLELHWDLVGEPEANHLAETWNLFVQSVIDLSKQVQADLSKVHVLQLREIERTDKVLALQKHGIPLNALIETYALRLPTQPWGDEPLVGAGQIPISVVYSEAQAAIDADKEPEGGEQESLAAPQRGARGRVPEGGWQTIQTAFDHDWNALQTAVEDAEKADAETVKRRRLHARWLASYAGLRKVARRRVRALVLRQRDETLRRIRKVGLPKEARDGATEVGNRKANVGAWLERILIDLKAEGPKITVMANNLIREGLELGGKQVGKEVEMPADWQFNLEAPAVRQRLARQAIKVRKVNETTREIVRRALLKGLEESDTVQEIGVRVGKAMGKRADVQSYRIANTEIHEALSAGRHEGFRQAGVRYQAWLTSGRAPAPEGPVRQSHKYAELATKNKPIKVGDRFTLRDMETGRESQCRFPGEGTLPPGERIHCSCVVIAKMTASGKTLSVDDYLRRECATYEGMLERRDAEEGKRQEEAGGTRPTTEVERDRSS
ncbi:MAG: phage portal protein [Phycisphaerae bacterium]|nr:phage portal protein [Phycisphaerae bacterium]